MFKIYLKLLQKYRFSRGWSLAELMMAAAMTLVIVMTAGFGLVMILRENKVANATGEMQYDLNRATEFITEEIRRAKTIETNVNDIMNNAPTFAAKHPDKTPILALKIDGIYERVIYYVDEVDNNSVWSGPGAIRRFGPGHYGDGGHVDPDDPDNLDKNKGRKPHKWQSLALVDMMALELDDEQKICPDLRPDPSREGEYTDAEGKRWYRFPRATADVQGFFSCVREDKQLAQINLVGTTLDEFEHLGYDQEGVREQKTRHSHKMEYNIVTIAHARSEVVGSSGEGVPSYRVNPRIFYDESGNGTLDVLYVNVPCYDGTTSTSVSTSIYTSESDFFGTVEGEGRGSTHSFNKGVTANPRVMDTRTGGCTTTNRQTQINVGDIRRIKYATNDTGSHTKLNDIIPQAPDNLGQLHNFENIVDELESRGLVREARDGTYNFVLPDNIVLYFVEFDVDETPLSSDSVTGELMVESESKKDSPYFDDMVFLMEVTR